MSNWADVRAFWARREANIREAGATRWGCDPYTWDTPGSPIQLTPIEQRFWIDIRAESVVLYPQWPVGRFFVDFANPCARVAIECDGAAWHQDAERDGARQIEIELLGWSVYRLTGRECNEPDDYRVDENNIEHFHANAGRRLLREIKAKHDITFGGRSG